MLLHDALEALSEDDRRRVTGLAQEETLRVLPVIQALRRHVAAEELPTWMATNKRIEGLTLATIIDIDIQNPEIPPLSLLPEEPDSHSQDGFDPSSTDHLGIYLASLQIALMREVLPQTIQELDRRRLLDQARSEALEAVAYVTRHSDRVLEIQGAVDGYNAIREYLLLVQLNEYASKQLDLWFFLGAVISLETDARLGEAIKESWDDLFKPYASRVQLIRHEGQWNLAAIRDHMNAHNLLRGPEWTTQQVRDISRRLKYRLEKLHAQVGINAAAGE